MIKGIDQSSYRMPAYTSATVFISSFIAQHYDPTFDGALKFKLIWRTRTYYEHI